MFINTIVACCNGSDFALHANSEGSTPSATTTLNKMESPKGANIPQGNSSPLFFDKARTLDEIYSYSNPILDAYSINWLF